MGLYNACAISEQTITQLVADAGRLHSMQSMSKHTHTRLRPFFSGTTRVSRYQKGKTNLDFTGARDSEWQWHQLGHMQVSTSLQTDNHASTPPFFTGRMPFLPPNQQCQSTEGTCGLQDTPNNEHMTTSSLKF